MAASAMYPADRFAYSAFSLDKPPRSGYLSAKFGPMSLQKRRDPMAKRGFHRIREVARRLGIAESTIRLRENRGEFPPPKRDSKGWRMYTEEDITKLEAYYLDPTR